MPAIRKDTDNGIILGVCAGISEWLDEECHIKNTLTTLRLIFLMTAPISALIYSWLASNLEDKAQCT